MPGARRGWPSCSTCRTATWCSRCRTSSTRWPRVHARWVDDTLMQCAAATLTEFAANPRWLGGIGAFTLVLHTWTQDLRRHLHVHALDGLRGAASRCRGRRRLDPTQRSPRFLFPVHALSRVFRGKFLHALAQAGERGALPRDPAATAPARQQRLHSLRRHDWVVYAKTPLAGPAAVLDYLARYTHRTAIGNERLVAIDGEQVLLRVRADDTGGKRVIAMPGEQFIGRLLQHVLPPGFKRIRHYGLLAPATKTARLALARKLLAMPAPTRRPARTRRPSCAAWPASRSSAARTAGSGAGASSSSAAPTVRPLPHPCLPPAEARRDARAQTSLWVQHRLAHAGPGPACRPRRTAHRSAQGHCRIDHTPPSLPPCDLALPLRRPPPRASALPTPAAETYTALSTAGPAVQSNEVYPTPCTTVPSISFVSASDKRYSLEYTDFRRV